MNSSKCEISDLDWKVIQKILPEEIYTGFGSSGGRPHADLRQVFCGILYWIRTGCQWDLIPRYYGSQTALRKYLKKWVELQVFDQLISASLQLYDEGIGIQWKFQSIDGSIKRAPGCTENAGKNPTDRARPGSKQMVLTDKKGIPLAVVIAPANHHDSQLLEKTFAEPRIERPHPQQVEQHLCADKGFDSQENRNTANEYGYHQHVKKRGEGLNPLKKYTPKRWVVERTHAWINQFRGIHTRRIRSSAIYQAMTLLACSCIILAKL
jgi:putative transposase